MITRCNDMAFIDRCRGMLMLRLARYMGRHKASICDVCDTQIFDHACTALETELFEWEPVTPTEWREFAKLALTPVALAEVVRNAISAICSDDHSDPDQRWDSWDNR